jgi:hypothetical protein
MTHDGLTLLSSRRSNLLEDIKSKASSGDSPALLTLSEQLRRVDQLIASQVRWAADVERFLSGSVTDEHADKSRPSSILETPSLTRVSGRGHGVAIRKEFLEKAAKHGLQLLPFRGAIYKSESGTRIGVAVATERQPNRWFLGLTQDLFDSAALLCQATSGNTVAVCLPRAFVNTHQFSRAGGQVKFNVVLKEDRFFLTIPNLGTVSVDHFVEAISELE